MLSVGIIGYGKLGTALAHAFVKLNSLKWIIEKDKTKLQKCNIKNIQKDTSLDAINIFVDYIFIVVNDSNIRTIAKQLAEKFNHNLKNTTIIHCSGTFGLDILSSCKPFAKNLASIHPYQTFYNPDKKLFKCAWTYNALKNFTEIENLIKSLGGIPFHLNDIDKTLYHLSAVIASNITTLLLSSSKKILSKLNLPPDKFITPIIKTTINNNIKSLQNQKEIPLTGPLARADLKTITKQLKNLSVYPELLKEYKLLLLFAIEHLKNNNNINESHYQELSQLLNQIDI